jgi:uncharacterized protein (DUF885 family)
MPLHRCAGSAVVALLCCLALLVPGCGTGGRDDAAFTRLTKEFFEDYFKLHPVTATMIGEHRFDGKIDDLSREAVERESALCRSYLSRIDKIDSQRLTRDDRVDAEILRSNLELIILQNTEVRSFERNPLLYTAIFGGSIYSLLSRDFAPLDERLDAAASRLEQFPRALDQAMKNLSNPARVVTETAIAQNRGVIALITEDLAREAGRAPGKAGKIAQASGPALDALRSFQDFLEKDLANRSLGDCRLGEREYRRELALVLQTDMTSEAVVASAYAEIDKAHEEMYALAAPLYAGMFGVTPSAGAAPKDKIEIIKAVLGEISKDHANPAGLLDAYKAAYEEAAGFVREKSILAIPDDPFEIVWSPEYSRGFSVVALESPGSLDKSMKYYLWVSPVPEYYDAAQTEAFMREYNSEMIRVLTIHEAVPGHFAQMARANRERSMVRAVFPNYALIEGWAVYCTTMMSELGFRETDPRFALQLMKFQLRSPINAILDSGMHRESMSEYEALRLLAEDGFQEPSEALGRWNRTCLAPLYLSTYFVGCQEIMALRAEAEERWGASFTLKRFHEALLSHGSIPLKYVREFMFER